VCAKLVDRLVEDNVVRTAAVETAFRRVPRHLFLPSFSVGVAYADEPVYTKQDGAGTSLSGASQPRAHRHHHR
jgi:protein-L-isoaspartate(D-aspartate) O-methyltransferase